MDLLNQITSGQAAPEQHFDQVARAAPQDTLSQGLAEAFRSDQTPDIGQMVGQLFGHSNSSQQAGVLNQLIAAVGPAVLAGAAGGALGKVMSPGATQVTPDQASKLSPGQVQDIVAHAEQNQPGIADDLGRFYAQHSGLIKTLGSAALVVALAKMKDHMTSR
jgi:hypothetical protein